MKNAFFWTYLDEGDDGFKASYAEAYIVDHFYIETLNAFIIDHDGEYRYDYETMMGLLNSRKIFIYLCDGDIEKLENLTGLSGDRIGTIYRFIEYCHKIGKADKIIFVQVTNNFNVLFSKNDENQERGGQYDYENFLRFLPEFDDM